MSDEREREWRAYFDEAAAEYERAGDAMMRVVR